MMKRNTMVTDTGDTWQINTGPARFEVHKTEGAAVLYQGDEVVAARLLPILTKTDGEALFPKAESVVIEEDNHRRTVILVSGHHVNEAGEPYFGFELRYFCYAGDPFVRVDHILKHDIVSADMEYGDEMKSFASLDLVFESETAGATQVATDEGMVELSDGERLFQHSDAEFEMGEATGSRAPGLISRGALTVAVRDFWQNWPKSLSGGSDDLKVGLYPAIEPSDRYTDRPNEWLLHYYIRDGVYTFRSGFQKRHELLMGPTDAVPAEELLARVNAPLLVTAPPQWYADSGALHGIASDDPDEFDMYDELLAQGIDNYFESQETRRWFGLMNFGDTEGGRANSWKNIEYDVPHGLMTQYFRTGDRRFYVAAEQGSRHNADVDVVHHAAGQVAGTGGPRRVGQAWVHGMGHTGGYYPYDYMGMSLYACGYCENEGHMWNQGNLEYWLLTGDEQVRRGAMQLGDWGSGPNTANFGYGNARVPGWMGIIAMSTYFATYDDYYLNGMRLMYEVVQELGDEKYGLWVHPLASGHCNCEVKHEGEAGFMAGVMMTALKHFYQATGDEEIAQRIVKIANFIADTMYEPEKSAFHYTSCPQTGVSPILTMITTNGMAFAANYSGDERLREIVRDSFVEGIIQLERGGAGAQIIYGLPIASAPYAMYEVGRIPGPSLREQLYGARQAAMNPATRPVPSLVPNPDFEETGDGWRTRPELLYEWTTEVSHTGEACAKATGKIAGQGEYFVTYYSCGPPWEIQWLEIGRTYRIQLWLRVDHIGDGIPAPQPRVAFRTSGVTNGGIQLTAYDMTRAGEWQMLEGEFEVPDYYDALYIAVSTGTRDPQEDVLMYLDDVNIVPAEAPRRDAYVYPSMTADEAELSGGVRLIQDKFQRNWTNAAPEAGQAGSASFTLDMPIDDDYRVLVRTKSPDADASFTVSIDGAEQATVEVDQSVNYDWVDALGDVIELSAGTHEITVTWPAGSSAAVQKICLTNEVAP